MSAFTQQAFDNIPRMGADGKLYRKTPWHAIIPSDDESGDDGLCVWDDFVLSGFDRDSEDELLGGRSRSNAASGSGTKQKENDQGDKNLPARQTSRSKKTTRKSSISTRSTRAQAKAPAKVQEEKDENPTYFQTLLEKSRQQRRLEALEKERKEAEEIERRAKAAARLSQAELLKQMRLNALSNTRRNLTRQLQFVLKLEVRSNKATKEGIRQTLDATVWDNTFDYSTANIDNLIDEIEHMSMGISQRMFLVDRHMRKLSGEARDEDGFSPALQLLSESDVKEWIRIELRTNHLAGETTAYYTAIDLAGGRSFRDWVIYLRESCGFSDHPTDEAKLVNLSWLFLDRDLRGPRPHNPTPVEDFVLDVERRWQDGEFAEALENPKKQQENDEKAWKDIRHIWSSGQAH